jgi:tRNA (guanine37-N1)-methyltransferase
VTKVYFSPRLSQERLRIAQKVRGGEVVIDMFAGVGPFSIQIAKKFNNVKVYAIDTNPVAIQFLKQNIALNKIENIFPLEAILERSLKRALMGRNSWASR